MTSSGTFLFLSGRTSGFAKLSGEFVLALLLLSQAGYSQTPNYALEFDGLNGYVEIDRTDAVLGVDWASEKTLSVWLNPTSLPGPAARPEAGELIVGNDRPRSFGITRATWDGEDRIWAFNWDANGVDVVGVPVTPDEWVQITVVHGGGALRIYRNGEPIESVPSGATESLSGTAVGSIYIGGSENGRTKHFGGQLDEVRLWSVGLAEPAIQDWVYRSLDSTHPNWSSLAAYYQMTDGSGTVLTDNGLLGHVGTLLGGMGDQSWVVSGAFGGSGSTNTPPIADPQSVTTNEDVPVSVLLTGSDADGDVLSFQVVSGPSSGSLSGTPPTLTYTGSQDFNGVDAFRFVANDGLAQSAEAEVTITVAAVNDPPVAVDDTAATQEASPVAVPVAANDIDVDGNLDVGSVTLLSGPGNGAVSNVGDGSLTYTPASGFVGTDTFAYQICDTDARCDDAAVTVDVSAVITPPVANDDAAVTDEDTQVTIDVAANDTDADGNLDPTSTLILTGPTHGGGSVNPDGSVTYSPAADFNGSDGFTYRICDSDGACDTASVSITVNPVNDDPVAVGDTAATPVSTPVVITVLDNDSDPDGDTLSITTVGQAANGTVEIVGDTLRYVPDSGFVGTDIFDYSISDGNGGSAAALVEVRVTGDLVLEEVGSILLPGDAWGVTIAGGLAYVADITAGLRIVDISVPSSPIEIGSFDTPTPGRTYDVKVQGDLAYLADGRAGLRILNIADPAAPFEVGLIDTPEVCWSVTLDLPYVYVGDRWGGLRIIDVSDPSRPVEVGFLDTPGQAIGVAVQGSLIWVADYDGGVRLVDVSDKANPVELRSVDFPGNVYGVLVNGGYLYVAQGLSGLAILDVSDPVNPVQVGWIDTPGLSRSVALMGGFAFLSDETEGVQVVDVSDPRQPDWTRTVDTPGRARGVAAADGYLFVADHEGGLRIIRVY